MHIEVLVEEPSAEAALANLLPELLPGHAEFAVRVFRGKHDLLRKLPARLAGYSRWIAPDWHIVVLVDCDADECLALKRQLDQMATGAGLVPRGEASGGRFHVLNRIAIEELEAWFFGDVEAMCAAYPHVPGTLAAKARYRDPDAIKGGTWEALADVLGYPRDRYPKIEVAREVSRHMVPEQNRSHSFQVFVSGIAELVAGDS